MLFRSIIMTGEHRVYKNKLCIEAGKLPNAIPLSEYNDTYLYCINTDTKKIVIGDSVFTDWDDLDIYEINTLMKRGEISDVCKLHNVYNGGFHEDTPIILHTNEVVSIKNLKCGSVTKDGDMILGIVKVLGSSLEMYTYNDNITRTSNIECLKGETRKNKTYSYASDILYHVITNTKKIHIGNSVFWDYDGCIENILGSNNNKA